MSRETISSDGEGSGYAFEQMAADQRFIERQLRVCREKNAALKAQILYKAKGTLFWDPTLGFNDDIIWQKTTAFVDPAM